MKLLNPAERYSAHDERQRNLSLELADKQNHKRGQDVEIGDARLVLKSPNGSRWSIVVDNSGNISASAL